MSYAPRVMLARETTAVHDCGESDCPCRCGYRYRRTLRQRDFRTELASELICLRRNNRGRLNGAVAAMTRLTKQVWNSAWQRERLAISDPLSILCGAACGMIGTISFLNNSLRILEETRASLRSVRNY